MTRPVPTGSPVTPSVPAPRQGERTTTPSPKQDEPTAPPAGDMPTVEATAHQLFEDDRTYQLPVTIAAEWTALLVLLTANPSVAEVDSPSIGAVKLMLTKNGSWDDVDPTIIGFFCQHRPGHRVTIAVTHDPCHNGDHH